MNRTLPGELRAMRTTPALVRARYREVILPVLRRLERRIPIGPGVAPGPDPAGLSWLVAGKRRDPLGEFLRDAAAHGDVSRRMIGVKRAHMVFHLLRRPEHIEYVLAERRANYPKSFSYQVLGAVMGDGLLTSAGETWLTHRRMLQPLFRRSSLESFVPAMASCVERTIARWDPIAASGGAIDVAEEMTDLTLDIVGRTLFSADLHTDAAALGRSLSFLLRTLDRRIESGIGILALVFVDLPAPGNRRMLEAIATLHAVVDGLIAQRIESGVERADMLSMLLAARDDQTGTGLTTDQVRDQVMTFLLAGHETTANALAWTWHLLSAHPDAARRVREEADTVLGDRMPAPEDLERLTYATAVVSESMRLYPPVWMFERDVLEDDVIGGFRIPAGSTVTVSPYVTHRHPELWPDPERFSPERFLTGERRPRFAYFPFGGGPRMCIGSSFAMQEAVIALAMLARRYRIEELPGRPVAPLASVTLRPRHGLQARVVR